MRRGRAVKNARREVAIKNFEKNIVDYKKKIASAKSEDLRKAYEANLKTMETILENTKTNLSNYGG